MILTLNISKIRQIYMLKTQNSLYVLCMIKKAFIQIALLKSKLIHLMIVILKNYNCNYG